MPTATVDLVTLEEIRAASARIEGLALRTPLLPFPCSFPGAWRGYSAEV